MNKLIAFLVLALLAIPCFASESLEDCRVVKVTDDNVFEEGLSTHEYPDIDVVREDSGKLYVSVGAMLDWEQANGDKITIKRDQSGKTTYTFRRKGSSESFTLFVTPRGSKGRREGRLQLGQHTIAIAYCKPR
jgi:hypothetical protein